MRGRLNVFLYRSSHYEIILKSLQQTFFGQIYSINSRKRLSEWEINRISVYHKYSNLPDRILNVHSLVKSIFRAQLNELIIPTIPADNSTEYAFL